MAQLLFTVTNDLNYDQRMIRICGTLAEMGHEVTLIGREKRASKSLNEQNFTQVRLKCWFEKGKLFYLEYNLRLLFFLLRQKFEVSTAIDLDTLAPVWLVCRIRGKKCIYDAHEYFSEVPEIVNRPLTKWVWEALARILIPKVDAAYTVGPALAAELSQRYGIDFGVVRNVPFRRQLELKPQQPPVILYQGMLNEGRGLEVAIKAMQWVNDAQLWLAGEGDLSLQLRQMSQDLGLEDKVQFLGYCAPADLPALTAQATLGLNLLENWGKNYYLSLANKAFDYIQAGIPSLQMRFPEYLALQNQYEPFCLIEELDPASLGQTITHLLNDAEWYERVQENCRRAGEELCWEREQQILLRYYG
jgi:glycosyltransferase involved in cell wall biosynthesis